VYFGRKILSRKSRISSLSSTNNINGSMAGV
jgi:hypothetical protein